VRHGFLIRYFDCSYSEADGSTFGWPALRIVSEYHDRSVKNISRSFSYLYDERFTAQILADVLVALDYLHSLNIEA
jgi:hypothetical protein